MLFSVELYGTQFLYLKDLTEVDPTGVLPLLVAVLMVFQQKMMPMGNMDPMQQKMMRLMPIGFGLFMFTFPSGLVLYFSINNTQMNGQPYPFNAPFFFIMNIAVGGNWPGYPDATTQFPQTMMVDYVRVFQ